MDKHIIAETKKYNSLVKKGKTIKLYRDELCPVCGFAATFIEAKFIEGALILVVSGCAQCHWEKYH